jgi:hypothetical protein
MQTQKYCAKDKSNLSRIILGKKFCIYPMYRDSEYPLHVLIYEKGCACPLGGKYNSYESAKRLIRKYCQYLRSTPNEMGKR